MALMGRPRCFCTEKALDQALSVFWRKGYEAATLTDLTQAMGINRPSLYAAFGNKEELFRKAMERYVAEKGAYMTEALSASTAYGVAERLLCGAAQSMTDPNSPSGCMAVKATLSGADETDVVKRELARIRDDYQARMIARFEQGRQVGELSADCDVAALVRFIITVAQGMAIQVAAGAGRDDLLRVARIALAAWPGLKPAGPRQTEGAEA